MARQAEIAVAKTLLEFSDLWRDYGILNDEELLALPETYRTSDDKNTEHYRYRVYMRYRDAHRPLTQETAWILFQLGGSDPDRAMGSAIQWDILNLPECPPALIEAARTSGEDRLLKAVERRERRVKERPL